MWIITGGMKTTPITAMEEFRGLVFLDLRREEKVLTHSEKLKRLPSHPAYQHLQAQTKNRLTRSSFNHLAKELKHTHRDTLPSAQEEQEPLQNAEAWNPGSHNLTCISEVLGVTKKGDQLYAALNALTQEMLQDHHTLDPCLHRRILRCGGQEWGQWDLHQVPRWKNTIGSPPLRKTAHKPPSRNHSTAGGCQTH